MHPHNKTENSANNTYVVSTFQVSPTKFRSQVYTVVSVIYQHLYYLWGWIQSIIIIIMHRNVYLQLNLRLEWACILILIYFYFCLFSLQMKAALFIAFACLVALSSAQDGAKLLASKTLLNQWLVEGRDMTVLYTIYNVGSR